MLSRVQYTHAIEIFAFRKSSNGSQSWIWMSTGRLIEVNFWDLFLWQTSLIEAFLLHGRMAQKSLECPNHAAAGTPAGACTAIGFFPFFCMELQLCHSLGEVSCLDEWFMCWAAAAWWAAVRVSRAVLQTKVLAFYFAFFFGLYFPHLAWWSPYMLVGGISMPLGHPSYWKHKFTLIQNNILAICI